MKLISFLKLGENRDSPRVWIESRRLNSLGFTPGVGFTIEPRLNGVRLRPALSAENHVSKRISARQERPIIDIANRLLLSPLDGFPEIKVTGAFRQIDVVPSARGFHIQRGLAAKPPFKTIEVFCGGGTLSTAIASNADFALVAGVEVEPKYADVWQQAHPRAVNAGASQKIFGWKTGAGRHRRPVPQRCTHRGSSFAVGMRIRKRARVRKFIGVPEPRATSAKNRLLSHGIHHRPAE